MKIFTNSTFATNFLNNLELDGVKLTTALNGLKGKLNKEELHVVDTKHFWTIDPNESSLHVSLLERILNGFDFLIKRKKRRLASNLSISHDLIFELYLYSLGEFTSIENFKSLKRIIKSINMKWDGLDISLEKRQKLTPSAKDGDIQCYLIAKIV